jgi:hypothetical protein
MPAPKNIGTGISADISASCARPGRSFGLMFVMHIRNLLLCFIRIVIDRYFFIGLLIRMFYIPFLDIPSVTLVLAFHISPLYRARLLGRRLIRRVLLSRLFAILLVTLLRLLLLVFLIVHNSSFLDRE